ncbi:hypothetical protein LEP1GSC108_4339 [Leptospira weilii str. UI 13098]|uniref:Uncharacterized protein n=1 Tax=Leptospira weilii str. UI 13098 TaxID=1088542 RepID=M6Q610_9LEPT|nr:hypothetical protein LEP1GSC108_4339 [Leptospira weilii str. UI 13098]
MFQSIYKLKQRDKSQRSDKILLQTECVGTLIIPMSLRG